MANVLPDGMGYNQFQCTAGVYDWEAPRTFESGSGLWGFLRASKSYIVKDPSFGVVGYGCRVETNGAEVTAYPKDGVRKRVRFVEQKVDVETTAGEIERVSLREGGAIELSLKDSTGLARVAVVTVKGDARWTVQRFAWAVVVAAGECEGSAYDERAYCGGWTPGGEEGLRGGGRCSGDCRWAFQAGQDANRGVKVSKLRKLRSKKMPQR